MSGSDWRLAAYLLDPIFGLYDLLVDPGGSFFEIWQSESPDLPSGPAFTIGKGGLNFPYGLEVYGD